MNNEMTELIGKRILVATSSGFRSTGIEERRVIEVSPSSQWVKLMNESGRKFWKPVAEVTIVEVLVKLEPCPSKEHVGTRHGSQWPRLRTCVSDVEGYGL